MTDQITTAQMTTTTTTIIRDIYTNQLSPWQSLIAPRIELDKSLCRAGVYFLHVYVPEHSSQLVKSGCCNS